MGFLCLNHLIEFTRALALVILLGIASNCFGEEKNKVDQPNDTQLGDEVITDQINVLDPVAEKQLNSIRHRLIEAAQKATSRVRSSSWLDSKGVLHESTRIRSDAVVRGMQIQAYLDTTEDNPISTNQCQENQGLYKRLGAIEMGIYPSDGRYGTYFLSDIAFTVARSLQNNRSVRDNWILTNVKKYRSKYDQAIGASSASLATYKFLVTVNAPQAGLKKTTSRKSLLRVIDNNYSSNNQKIDGHPVELSIVVSESKTGTIVWEKMISIEYPSVATSITSRAIPPIFESTIKETMEKWGRQLNTTIGCQPLFFDILDGTDTNFTINGGARVGIRPGDQLLIANREKIPSRVLEKGALEQTVLVEVESVTPDRARLVKIAGPAISSINNMAAMPL